MPEGEQEIPTDETEKEYEQQQYSSNRQPPPSACYNPIPSGAPVSSVSARDSSGSVSKSVVPDLMRVYESMTQSSTPQNAEESGQKPLKQSEALQAAQQPATADGPASSNEYYHHGFDHQDSEGFYQPLGGWTYDATSVPVPPIPEAAYAAMSGMTGELEPSDQEVAPTSRTTTSGRSLRKRAASASNLKDEQNSSSGNSKGAKKRRKGKDSDGRWSKRFSWPDDLHRDFVSAIFDVGLKHSSPSTILECMPEHEQITSERIKSHLQKYRLHRVKSKKEFMSSYEATLCRLQREGLGKVKSLSGGEVPAHLTYVTMTDSDNHAEHTAGEVKEAGSAPPEQEDAAAAKKAATAPQGALMLPRLTEEEKRSPIGASMGYLMGLFFSLKQQLMAQRIAQSQSVDKKNQPVAAAFDSFVSGQPPAGSQGQIMAPLSAAGVPSTRSNLEESTMMKREMQSQMAFQNKMRALKQQELNKYKRAGEATENEQSTKADTDAKAGETATAAEETGEQEYQGAGETACVDGSDNRERNRDMSISIGGADDFWNTDVMDDQLFEFLMSS